MNKNAVIESLIERRSVKSYKAQQISDQELDIVLEAATYAPTGMNKQSPIMVVVQDAELIAKIAKLNARVMNFDGDPFYGAPTVVIVFGNTEILTWMEDATLVAGNLLNAAHAIGLGSCWIHRARQVFEMPDGIELKKQWGIPESFIGVANIILGYQDQPAKPRGARKENYIIKIK